jgi:fermentation-respiration switch protein FrsA (DUF1100 family)
VRLALGRQSDEWRAFAVASAAIALNTITDAFLAPERGTSWRDHLVSGVVPLAVVVGSTVVYGRLRPGARAAAAAALGLLALEGAALALADAQRGTIAAADWTGLLLAPAGLVLCALAIRVAWRAHRQAGRRRYLRRAGIVVGVLLAAYWVLVPVGMALYATHRPRAEVRPAELGTPYREVAVPTADSLELAAWYVPSRNGAAVISFPTRVGKLAQARMRIRHGYGVLLLDMRGYEGSEGSANAFGWGATKDIDAATEWLRRRPEVDRGRIGGIGFSVGGEVMIEAAAENPALRAVVAEGAGVRSVREALLYGVRGWLAVPTSAVQTLAVSILGDTAPPRTLDDAAARVSPRALFLIYAGGGTGGEELNPKFFRAAKQPKAIWKIPEAAHVGGLDARPAEYERRVIGFFDRALLGKSHPAGEMR